MRILTYKRTHIGDPNEQGEFGSGNCMGRVRNWEYDAVIGVGGYGQEPQDCGIAGRVNWIGVNPTRLPHPKGTDVIVTFEKFWRREQHGPLLHEIAPALARRMYETKARVLLRTYSRDEKLEAETLIQELLADNTAQPAIARESIRSARRCAAKCKPRKLPRGAT